MSAAWILIVGMLVVVCGVLVLRLHALLALIAGGLVVALLTPAANAYRTAARLAAIEVESVDSSSHLVMLRMKGKPAVGMNLLVLRGRDLHRVGMLRIGAGGGKDVVMTEALDGVEIDRRDVIIEPEKDAIATGPISAASSGASASSIESDHSQCD